MAVVWNVRGIVWLHYCLGRQNNYENIVEEVADGIEGIVWLINTRQPQAKIIGFVRSRWGAQPFEAKNARVNQLLKVSHLKLTKVQLLDRDSDFVHSDSAISCHDMFYFLDHIEGNYAKICKALHDHAVVGGDS